MKANLPAKYTFTLVQGDSYQFRLVFFIDTGNGLEPEDLTQFDDIIWAFRTEPNINLNPFEVKSVSSGQLKIEGDDNNELVLEFDQELYATQRDVFFHACVFIKDGKRETRIDGVLNNYLNTVKESDVTS